MAPPMSADRFLKALKDEGVTVVEVGSWRSHNRNSKGAWGPVNGVMIHHTVTSGSARTVDICRNGYSGLPGPLCHGVITKDGRVHLVGYGRANHAGLGDDDVLAAVIAERASYPRSTRPTPTATPASTASSARTWATARTLDQRPARRDRAGLRRDLPRPRLEPAVGHRPPGVAARQDRSPWLHHEVDARAHQGPPEVRRAAAGPTMEG